jgi:ribosomal protein S6
MKKYELLLVLPGTLDEKESEVKAQEVLNLVKEYGEEAELVEMGKNRLAYPIKQIRYGYFYTVIFQAEAEKIKELQVKLGLMRDLLRAVISHFKVKYSPGTAPLYSYNKEENLEERVVAAVEPKAEYKEEIAVSVAPRKTTLDLKDIDKKLDEILDEKNLVAGV